MYWKITQDHLEGHTDDSQQGREFGKRRKGEEMVRFVIKDDDNITSYQGIINAKAAETEDVFDPLDWAMDWAGATRMYINGEMV